MIKTLVFDFGNVFINLDIDGAKRNMLDMIGAESFFDDVIAFNNLYELGFISTKTFVDFYLKAFPKLSKDEVIKAWNNLLKDFPRHRLDFLMQLKKEHPYHLMLLSNTNELHIDWVVKNVPFYETFKSSFHRFYLSHEIHLRKPNHDIFEFILNQNDLKANQCLFIDDNQDNIKAAEALGFNIWHIDPKTEDVTDLFKIKKQLF